MICGQQEHQLVESSMLSTFAIGIERIIWPRKKWETSVERYLLTKLISKSNSWALTITGSELRQVKQSRREKKQRNRRAIK
jgi:hypothetical protein